MILKKHKAVIAAILSAALTASAVVPTVASAAGSRTKTEKYGEDSYVERFLSLYDDVVTNGAENGYLSKDNTGTGSKLGVPYHAVEELIIEAPDYGHETTSEAMSYIVWMAAMRDAISKDGKVTLHDGSTKEVDKSSDLMDAWRTMEVMIPGWGNNDGIQKGFWSNTPSATLSLEWEAPDLYNDEGAKMFQGNNGVNPIHTQFTQAYSGDGDKGLYLMHWLADVDDWYGYGGRFKSGSAKGKFTFINTFQRGAEESCWETVPHPSVETLDYGMSGKGIKAIFKTSTEDVPAQWSYTNAPDAEDRAIQAVYYANRMGVGNNEINALAGKMGDELRNNMFDKYYKTIGTTDYNKQQDTSNAYSGAHYLMSWYTSWGGAVDGGWTWQIGASHCHEFYQNPLAAFALLTSTNDGGFKENMKVGSQAVKDYEESLKRQMEYYLWLQSADGPIAGGSTSSWNGRYEVPKYPEDEVDHYGSATPSKFYDMSYVEHPVYLDPGSNHWIGNQVWAVQRLAEMYYLIKAENRDTTGVQPANMSLEDALKIILDRWVEWFVGQITLYPDGTFEIPATLDWHNQPADWNGLYKADANKNLTCTVTAVGGSDLGCVSSLCNSLIYYAKANGVKADAAYSKGSSVAEQALYYANELLDREWQQGRDDIGLSITEHNGSMRRLFTQDVYIPDWYKGTMPNGDPLENGATFLSFRTEYNKVEQYFGEFKAAYDSVSNKSDEVALTEAMETVDLNYHRFWHAGDILIAMGTMYDMYPEVDPNKHDGTPDNPNGDIKVTPGSVEVEVGKSEQLTVTVGGNKADATFKSSDESVATVDSNGKVTGVSEGSAKIEVEAGGKKTTVDVTVKASSSTKPTASSPTSSSDKPTSTPGTDPSGAHWGDANVDGSVDVADCVAINQYNLDSNMYPLTAQGTINADVTTHNGVVDAADSSLIMNYVAMFIGYEELCP